MNEPKKSEVSPAAAERIVAAINFKLWEFGFGDDHEVRALAISLSTRVKRIVLEDKGANGSSPAA